MSASAENRDPTRTVAIVLGAGGLVPFAALCAAAWALPADQRGWAVFALAAYGACILSFIGALHWGFALARRVPPKVAAFAMVWSVVPSLVAWVSLLLPAPVSLGGVAAGLFVAWLVDAKAWRAYGVAGWFPKLRIALTVGACASLLLAMPVAR